MSPACVLFQNTIKLSLEYPTQPMGRGIHPTKGLLRWFAHGASTWFFQKLYSSPTLDRTEVWVGAEGLGLKRSESLHIGLIWNHFQELCFSCHCLFCKPFINFHGSITKTCSLIEDWDEFSMWPWGLWRWQWWRNRDLLSVSWQRKEIFYLDRDVHRP